MNTNASKTYMLVATLLCLVQLTIGSTKQIGSRSDCTWGKDSVDFEQRLRSAMSSSRPHLVALKVACNGDTLLMCERVFTLVHIHASRNNMDYPRSTDVVVRAIIDDSPLGIWSVDDYQKFNFYRLGNSAVLDSVDTTLTLNDALGAVSADCRLRFTDEDKMQRLAIVYRLTKDRFNLVEFEDSVRVEGRILD